MLVIGWPMLGQDADPWRSLPGVTADTQVVVVDLHYLLGGPHIYLLLHEPARYGPFGCTCMTWP
ncbi:hypothetical protein H681_06420 [Pseudomonas sp. ATCC 13867]|nr:hypothetical protein H681_06420 [Pseudomonas sp. ATCC 13867]